MPSEDALPVHGVEAIVPPSAPSLMARVFRAAERVRDGAWQTRSAQGDSGAGEESNLKGLRVLIVEDEFLLALEVEAALQQLGCSVVGPIAKLGKALDTARRAQLDAAILDINLNGEMVYPLAELLASQGVPFIFLTGYAPSDLPDRYRLRRRLPKPLDAGALRHALLDIQRGR